MSIIESLGSILQDTEEQVITQYSDLSQFLQEPEEGEKPAEYYAFTEEDATYILNSLSEQSATGDWSELEEDLE